MIASGDLPDFFYVSPSQFEKLASTGQLEDITKVVQDYASKYTKQYLTGDYLGLLEAVTKNGKIYGLPNGMTYHDQGNMLWIREDNLKKAGLEAPKTVADLDKVLEAFKKNDYDGKGNEKYPIPLADARSASSGMWQTLPQAASAAPQIPGRAGARRSATSRRGRPPGASRGGRRRTRAGPARRRRRPRRGSRSTPVRWKTDSTPGQPADGAGEGVDLLAVVDGQAHRDHRLQRPAERGEVDLGVEAVQHARARAARARARGAVDGATPTRSARRVVGDARVLAERLEDRAVGVVERGLWIVRHGRHDRASAEGSAATESSLAEGSAEVWRFAA